MGFLFGHFVNLVKPTLSLVVGSLILTACSGAAFAIEDKNCLDCHRDLNLRQVSPTGELRPIYVDPQVWDRDIHHEKGIRCIDCHEGMTPFSHPKERTKKVLCARCHPEAGEENELNIHNTLAGITDRALPECYDCHTKHGVRGKDDPESTVSAENIGNTCYACHEDVSRKSYISLLPTRILLGHRKCDVNDKFDMLVCVNCHGDAGHGPLTTYPEYCGRCHNTKKEAGFWSATHPGSLDRGPPIRFFMDGMSLALNLALIIGAVMIFSFLIARSYRMRKKGNLEDQRDDREEEKQWH